MGTELNNAITQLQQVITTLNADQETIDALNAQLTSITAAKVADDAIIAAEKTLDTKESVLDYLRGKGRLLRNIPPIADETETILVPLLYVSETPELYLIHQMYSDAGFVYTLNTL